MANLARFTPFEDLLSDFARGFWVKPFTFPGETEPRMKIDVNEDDKAYTVRAEIPGVKKEDIHVEVADDQVSLRAEVKQEKEERAGEKVIYSERTYGMTSRSFTLPGEVDANGAKADYKDGILQLTLPKKANGSAKRITVS